MDTLSAQLLLQNATVRTRKALVLLDVQASPSWGERATAIEPAFPNRCDELISRLCELALVLSVCSTSDTGREVFSKDGLITTENSVQSQQWAVQRQVGIIEDKDDSGLELTNMDRELPNVKALGDRTKALHTSSNTYSAHYDAVFKGLMRENLITELYICAGGSNSFVVSTATIAAAQGIRITIVEDCVGRLEENVIHRLSEDLGAQYLPCQHIVHTCKPSPQHYEKVRDGEKDKVSRRMERRKRGKKTGRKRNERIKAGKRGESHDPNEKGSSKLARYRSTNIYSCNNHERLRHPEDRRGSYTVGSKLERIPSEFAQQ
ncbi:hypothetical protein LTR81_028005, partial [Elasticomyces elasticus]